MTRSRDSKGGGSRTAISAGTSVDDLVARLPVAIYRTSLEGAYFYVNLAFARLFGYATAEELIGTSALDFYAVPEERDRLRAELAREGVVHGFEALLRRLDRSTFWARIFARVVRDPAGRVLCYEGAVEPIEDLKEVEERLLVSERQYRLLFETNPNPMWVYDQDTLEIVAANEASLRQYGYTLDEFLRLTIRDIAPPDELADVQRAVAALPQGMGPKSHWHHRRKDGSTFPVEVVSHSIPFGGRRGRMILVKDVTESERYESDLRAARDVALESSRLKSAFLANISHEIRTPLNVILGYVSILLEGRRPAGAEDEIRLLEGIERAGRRLLDMLHGILDLARIDAGTFSVNPELLAIRPLVDAIALQFAGRAKAKSLGFDIVDRCPLATVSFDEYCLRQALDRLLDNAIKFTSAGGVTVEIDRDPAGRLTISVIDTGIGISPEFRARLFHAFSQQDEGTTRRFEGAGIGLALARVLIERSGGSLSVESEKGVGTTFRIHLEPSMDAARPEPERETG
jgi:PAS domain S-box-containing protein